MDPTEEHLHRLQQEQIRSAPSRREHAVETVAGGLLLLVCGLLAWRDGWGEVDLSMVALFVALSAAFWQVRFDIGTGATTPMQLLFVPMWFVFSPAMLPLVLGAGQILGTFISAMRDRDEHHWARSLIGLPDAWYAVGPAIVLALFDAGPHEHGAWWVYGLALVAQFALDAASALARVTAANGIPWRDQVDGIWWMWGVDAALSSVGFAVAISVDDHPAVLLTLVPLAALLAQFAKERDDRIVKALELSSAYRGTAQLMGDVLEADDAYTGGEHTQGVVELSLAIGRTIGLDPTQMRTLEFGALLHDIGKLRVPNEIINKPGKLTDEEWAIIKLHPAHGQEMLDRVGGELSHAGRVVRAHHERWDGNGYPDGLAGDAIPVEARIITVCDSFSAMTTNRSYRKGMSHAEALAELDRCAAAQFDPKLVAALKQVLLNDRSIVPEKPRPVEDAAGGDASAHRAA